MKLLLLSISVLTITGCATHTDQSYINAQLDSQRLAYEAQKPLVEIIAQPGQQVTGLGGIRVYMPVQAQQIQQSRPNEWAGVAGQALGVVGTVGGIYYAGRAAVNLANTVGANNAAIASQIQAPGATTNNTLSGTGTLGSGAYGVDTTHAPTVITTPNPLVVNPVVVQPQVVTVP